MKQPSCAMERIDSHCAPFGIQRQCSALFLSPTETGPFQTRWSGIELLSLSCRLFRFSLSCSTFFFSLSGFCNPSHDVLTQCFPARTLVYPKWGHTRWSFHLREIYLEDGRTGDAVYRCGCTCERGEEVKPIEGRRRKRESVKFDFSLPVSRTSVSLHSLHHLSTWGSFTA